MPKPLEPIDLKQLPAEVQAAFEVEIAARVKAELQARDLQRAAVEREDTIKRLEHLVRELRHALYGKRSEKLSPDERQLAFEDLEVAVAEAEEHQARLKGDAPKKKAGKPRRNLGNLPEDLPRVTKVVEPDSTACPCGCGEMERIGEDRTERLDIIPARLRVIVTVRPKYACPACKGGVTQAKTPPHLIEGALPTEGAIAHVLVSKYADHAPLYRQAQMLGRSGLQIDRSTLAGWVGKAAFHLTPIVDRMAEHLKTSTKLFMPSRQIAAQSPAR